MAKKQKELPGMERPTIKELDAALEDFAVKEAALKLAKKASDDAKLKLVEVARKHGQLIYRDESASPPLTLVLTDGPTKVKVTRSNTTGAAVDEEEITHDS
jgi:hypothetical protein